MNVYDVIIRPMFTEKSTTQLMENNKYMFEVHPDANKMAIKEAVETCFEVKVGKVNTIVRKGKKKRIRMVPGYTKLRKFAIVTVSDGTIELI